MLISLNLIFVVRILKFLRRQGPQKLTWRVITDPMKTMIKKGKLGTFLESVNKNFMIHLSIVTDFLFQGRQHFVYLFWLFIGHIQFWKSTRQSSARGRHRYVLLTCRLVHLANQWEILFVLSRGNTSYKQYSTCNRLLPRSTTPSRLGRKTKPLSSDRKI